MRKKLAPKKQITKLSDIKRADSTVKNLVQKHINIAKTKRTPRERDMVAVHLMKQLIKKLEACELTQQESIDITNQWNRYIEYAGEHEIHDMYSLELNVYATLISGLYNKELFFQIRRVCRQAARLKWYNPMVYFRTLLYDEADARVFIVDRLEADEAVAYTLNKKIDQELMGDSNEKI